ncbi:hypothetical protein NLI96_g11708 [Meripilus lineatus]|uniref:Epoxide hydrolase N-terminal domain-containing protein n=1 Tax=Meripilus lineatus TaxID=2056292 RepID=A0AAD5USW1_9APHY|nr:hypothetical protein NLI96_g11708 [Physisporinus lineatus]
MSENPFKVDISDSEINLLKKKLDVATFPDEIDEAGWAYGVPLADMKRLVEKWRTTFDWKKREKEINQLPMFTRDVDIEGFGPLNIHYVHQKSKVDGAIPLLFIHGWPGHFLEVERILPLLAHSSPEHPSFHVVAFSLPGFGFSETPKGKGFAISQYAETGHKLMLALGYNEYVLQGGDWGGIATQPQTLGYSLADSPVGLLAWIYEKLVNWADDYPWDDDEVLQWVSIYWFSRPGPTASIRIYYESYATAGTLPFGETSVPLGISYFPKELVLSPRSWSRTLGNVVFESEHEGGGHFAAHEKPVELVSDLRKMFGKGGPAYGVVSGKNGYAKS